MNSVEACMDVGLSGHLFGLPCTLEEARWVLLPVPWAVTASYRGGAEEAPAAILAASAQVDHALLGIAAPWALGVHMLPILGTLWQYHHDLRPHTSAYMRALEQGASHRDYAALRTEVNSKSTWLCQWVKQQVEQLLATGKRPAVLGGEHAVVQGAVEALLVKYPSMGLLQIDAHMDMRPAYLGFKHSHASWVYNVLENTSLTRLVQFGIREFSAFEQAYATAQGDRVHVFYADTLHSERLAGKSYEAFVDNLLQALPQQVYISLDIDGLAPAYCPAAGTPAAGGLAFEEVIYVLQRMVIAGKQIVGFDLVEVVPDSTGVGQVVASQLLYRLFSYAGLSEGLLRSTNE